MMPRVLAPNQPPRFYAGGPAIARFRGLEPDRTDVPEDWVASTTTFHGEAETGLTRLDDGRWLRDAIQADPVAWLGERHAERFGDDPALLVKLLDAGQRLPVHVHPDRSFARRHLDCDWGKTEAWVVLGVQGAEPVVHLGFRRDVSSERLADWVRGQKVEAMLGAMHTVPVATGDTVLVPAGLPHSIGEGVFVLELQEPTDFSVMLESDGIPASIDGQLGLDLDVAMDCVDRAAWSGSRLDELRRPNALAGHEAVVERLLPAAADPYFRADVVRGPRRDLAASFAVLVAVAGTGTVTTEAGDELPLSRGQLLLVPHAARRLAVSAGLQLVRCRPPDPAAVPS